MQQFWQRLRAMARSSAANVVGDRPPWKSKSVLAAGLAMLVGLGWWGTEAVERSKPPQGTNHATFSEQPASPPTRSAARPDSPALFRLGAGYLGGFFLGWSFRRFLKVSALVAGAAIAGIALLKSTGLVDLDWGAVQTHVSGGLAWLHGEAEGVRRFFTGYLPSATAGAVGVFRGFRRR